MKFLAPTGFVAAVAACIVFKTFDIFYDQKCYFWWLHQYMFLKIISLYYGFMIHFVKKGFSFDNQQKYLHEESLPS